MSIPKLQVQLTPGKIGITIQKPEQIIKQYKAEQSIQQPKAKINIQQNKGKLTIDQTKAWHNLDLKNAIVRTEELVGIAKNKWMEGLARVSREGDELMRIENGGNPIAAQAERNGGFGFTYQSGGRPTRDLVDIQYQPGDTQIDIQPHEPVIDTKKHAPEHHYRPGNVDLKMELMPDLKIDWKV
ncbi:hypothetical protein SAMN05192559_101137 [Halobacillus karajensis]|uniref:YviE n=1 Tax=Halobacillus karajensis TaxID=195088 RepID=A0A059NWH6_9BACI|nr:DUF6470 family protein [Halobacillus karajensis]CDQ19210.1 hypothetical protein BN982_01495 [Halobacillus karajensis]CDQ22716.1 hypothetical protein BN983_00931 [Halobacillus karajensis]CDQ26198.1 hypothetical protein BN981_00411 [Halobacillus karajensis]SEH40006.1 hypothetical protein SAMN05192559_101137 [Halobacillus karajensis]